MTLTAPGCGMGQVLTDDVTGKLRALPGVGEVKVDLTFDPPWGPERMSEEGRLELGMFY
jgi:metal-sulfur cluster biosynthetic enzyme